MFQLAEQFADLLHHGFRAGPAGLLPGVDNGIADLVEHGRHECQQGGRIAAAGDKAEGGEGVGDDGFITHDAGLQHPEVTPAGVVGECCAQPKSSSTKVLSGVIMILPGCGSAWNRPPAHLAEPGIQQREQGADPCRIRCFQAVQGQVSFSP